MRQRDRLIVNSLISVVARIVTVATRFVIVPFSISIVGRANWGIWVICGQFFAYTAILDMGMRSAVAKRVSEGLVKKEHESLNRYVNTAAGYYSIAGMVIALGTLVLCYFFPIWFKILPEHHTAARVMILISGLTLAFAFPQNAYSAVVAGLQRYDVIAGSNVLADLLRLALILLLLKQVSVDHGLIILAVASGGPYLLGAMTRTFAALRLCTHVRFQPWRIERNNLDDMLSFGLNSVVYMMSINVGMQLAQIVIGALMGADAAADMNVAGTFILAAHAFVIAFGISTRVVASRYDGGKHEAMLRLLLLRSTRYSAFLSLAGMTALWLYADVLFRLWIGRQYTGAAGQVALTSVVQTCRVLIGGYGLFWLSLPAYNVINGMGRHRFPAGVAFVAGLTSMVLVVVLALSPEANIHKVAWGIVLPMIPAWGIIMPWYCCKQTQQPIGSFIKEGLVVPLLAVIPAGIIGFLWNTYAVADSWPVLILQLTVCSFAFLATGWVLVLKRDDRSAMIDSMRSLTNRFLRR